MQTVYKMRNDCRWNGMHLFCVTLIGLLGVVLKSTGMSQDSMESERLNEVSDDSYPDFSVPSSPAKSNLTAFLLSYSKSHFSDKTTRKGLDITSPEIFESKTGAQLYAVFPGTIWCGVGNLAGNSQALGFFANTDSCCRTHDKCQVTIPPDSNRFGLKNTGYFTRSHCQCDEKFYFCLKRAGSIVANKVGFTYFNILRPQCFRKDFPIVACLRWYGGRCLTYVVDQSDTREWQWFDNRQY